LKYPAVQLTGLQAKAVGEGFKRAVEESGYCIHACSILPEHVHLVMGRNPRPIRQIVGHLKGRATQELMKHGQWPPNGRPVWGIKSWNVFLNDSADMRQAIKYVEENPVKEGMRRQRWSFVVPWNG
jgi:REP element-mobilizing transposase RayT